MRVALVHYHLQSGGVTRIICHLQKALAGRGITTVVLTGKPPAFDFPGSFRVVPGLQYEAARPAISSTELAAQMGAAAREALAGAPDLWHVHNHSLGKSLVLPGALFALARRGERLLFHIHDFAEDGRPGNYRTMLQQMVGGRQTTLSRLLYPQAEHLHYTVLNSRDRRYLQDAGLDPHQLHLLANPVDLDLPEEYQSRDGAAFPPLWIYPTRAIRRKNLGELLLWSAMAPEETRFATTSAPENPTEWNRYARWKEVAAELKLPLTFEGVGLPGLSFVEMLRRARGVITTSVAEGFGMAFLEPWSLGIPVCGRNLPEITAGFREEGIVLPWSYDRFDVPLSWLGRERVIAAAEEGLQRNLAAYGRCPGKNHLERLLAAWIQEGMIDFGRLDEPLQETVLRRMAQSPGLAADLRPGALPEPDSLHGVVGDNRNLLRSRYNLDRYGTAVEQVYQQVVASPVTPLDSLDCEVLLDRFLAPERLSLLRVD